MLTKLNQLTLETEGRYATDNELSFLDEYIDSLSVRIDTYQKIKDLETEIINQIQNDLHEINLDDVANHDLIDKSCCGRDAKIVLRHSACAVLIDDCERLRESLLLWHRTIIFAFRIDDFARIMFLELMPSVLADLLTEKEYDLMKPSLQLSESVLA